MTAAELYAADADLRTLVATWAAERRPPFPLADYLRDAGLDGPADVAAWVYNGPVRRCYWKTVAESYPFPCPAGGVGTPLDGSGQGWYWMRLRSTDLGWDTCEWVPGISVGCSDQFPTRVEALLWLLDNMAIKPEPTPV